jgi:hypothetical protein
MFGAQGRLGNLQLGMVGEKTQPLASLSIDRDGVPPPETDFEIGAWP